MFIHYHHHCGMKVIMMLISNIAAILFCSVVYFCRSSGGSVLVNCFMCMVVLVLRIAYGQVVLLRTVLNFVA
jgi:hypothetical protein